MPMKKLTPYQVVEIENPRVQPKKPKRRRSNSLACYVPLGDAQASRRVTGSHLDPDSFEMEAAAVDFASGLVQAIHQGGGVTRSIIGPARYSDRVLAKYCGMLVKGAFGMPVNPSAPPISPALVPYLLGGIPLNVVEELCYRALEVMDFFPDPLVKSTWQRAVSGIGFGAHIPHAHHDTVIKYGVDGQPVEVEVAKTYNHLSFRQDFLLNLPREGSYATILIKQGAYSDTLRRQLAAWKPQMMAEVEELLDPGAGHMTEYAAKDRRAPVLTDWTFRGAVERVFQKPWHQLNLNGRPENVLADAEVLLARKIIQKITYNDQISAETLIGMSLLTGVSVVNWVQFAVDDRARRGMTFLQGDEVDRAVEMLDVSPHFTCKAEMLGLAAQLRIQHVNHKWARRLQSPNLPLWSTTSSYYLSGYDSHDNPRYTHKAFPPPSEK